LGTEVYVVESRLVTDGIGWVLAPTRVKYKITYYNRQYTKEVHHAVLKLTKTKQYHNNTIRIPRSEHTMPYSYTKHFNDYRRERQKNTLPKRNVGTSMVNPISGEVIELDWEGQRRRVDKEVELFRYKQALTKKLIEIYKKEIKRLASIIKSPLYIEVRGDYDHRRDKESIRFWKSATGYKVSLTEMFKRREEPYFDTDNAGHVKARWKQVPVSCRVPKRENFSAYSRKVAPTSLATPTWNREICYLHMVDTNEIVEYAEQLVAYADKAKKDFNDFVYFYKAHEYNGRNWKRRIDELVDENPYKQFRIDFEVEVQKIRDQKEYLEKKIAPLIDEWDSYYCDEKNLEARQDELDKKYRQRVEREKELKARLKEKREAKMQLERKQLIAEVKVEMAQWKDDIHSGKVSCGCTSSPNAEGIRALKKHYSTLEDATEGARNALLKSGLHLRPYKCPVKKSGRDGRHYACGGYHLTKFEG
jgi:hypothetical protein